MGTLAPELWIFIYSLVLIVAHYGICLTDIFDFISQYIKYKPQHSFSNPILLLSDRKYSFHTLVEIKKRGKGVFHPDKDGHPKMATGNRLKWQKLATG